MATVPYLLLCEASKRWSSGDARFYAGGKSVKARKEHRGD